MRIRYAKGSDFDFLMDATKKTMLTERWPVPDQKAFMRWHKKEYRDAIRKKTVRVLDDGKNPVGFLYFKPGLELRYIAGKVFWVDFVYVKEGYRNRGLGHLLYADAVRIAKKAGYKKIFCDIFQTNRNSIDFHEKLGFESVYTVYKMNVL